MTVSESQILFLKVFNKLVESYALDALDWFDSEKEFKVLKGEVTKFLNYALKAQVESHPSVALGTDCRLESKKVNGFALALDDEILHLSFFTRRDQKKKKGYTSRMERFSGRRRRK